MAENARRLKSVEGGSKTVYLVTPMTYEGAKADDERRGTGVRQACADRGRRWWSGECGVASVGFSVIQPTGDDVPIGIE
jgi:hypothetical protein